MSEDKETTINWEGYEIECSYTWDAPKVLLHEYTCSDKQFNRNWKGDFDVECQICDLISIQESEYLYDEGDRADYLYESRRDEK